MRVTVSPVSGTVGEKSKEAVGPGSGLTVICRVTVLLAPRESVALALIV